ncbi:RSPRY1 [Lepeophtheirus salmonis]|uniref:RSPRY1 n=1 Tax=Lepeophtheirus salmonis TaxID=72036 RepID=A0A7R8D5A2_LEPSM|nr:RSPRY1 [Lepeophtheirus salmonis]CAF3004147.1 RSPRY1 [Lepeophtheirus salmonis]
MAIQVKCPNKKDNNYLLIINSNWNKCNSKLYVRRRQAGASSCENDESKSGGGHQDSCCSAETASIKCLILETLSVYRTIVENNEDPPLPMLKLHSIAYTEEGWLRMVESLIQVIPINEPIGPASITLLLDECPLPSAATVGELIQKLELKNSLQDYLLSNLQNDNHPALILFSIIAIEKFCQTTENKSLLLKRLVSMKENPFLHLEKWVNREEYLERQVGVCAQWLLDNMICIEERPFSYKNANMDGINVILNSNDVSEYLKITPDGLEARCDAFSFESVRCTFQVDEGVWFYEVVLATAGIMQIGWATKDSKFLNYDGYGIGDDPCSLAYDGCRQLIWYNAQIYQMDVPCWKPGSKVNSFNNYGHLSPDQKLILPRHIKLAKLEEQSVNEDACTLCFDDISSITLKPCGHTGFCENCANQLKSCPMCRIQIESMQNAILVESSEL